MAPPEYSYPARARHEPSNKPEAQENNLKINIMKMIEILTEEMKKMLTEIQEKANKKIKGYQ